MQNFVVPAFPESVLAEIEARLGLEQGALLPCVEVCELQFAGSPLLVMADDGSKQRLTYSWRDLFGARGWNRPMMLSAPSPTGGGAAIQNYVHDPDLREHSAVLLLGAGASHFVPTVVARSVEPGIVTYPELVAHLVTGFRTGNDHVNAVTELVVKAGGGVCWNPADTPVLPPSICLWAATFMPILPPEPEKLTVAGAIMRTVISIRATAPTVIPVLSVDLPQTIENMIELWSMLVAPREFGVS